ncbi:MAG: hypothetical protein GX322_08480 [Firmicutes bacterium]|nr:hypothetical protein [Bacillota bacterium]
MVLAAKRQVSYEESWETPAPPKQPVKRHRRLRLHPMLLLVLASLIVVGLTALGIGQKIRAIELEYELQSLETELEEVRREGQQLQLKVEQLQSLANIEAVARERLGMVDPQAVQVLAMDWDPSPDTQLATAELGSRIASSKKSKSLWVALAHWVGARIPALGTAEAGLLKR